jgi:two-component system OmpR family response regulator
MNAKPLERILFVEDNPGIRTIAELALVTVGGFAVDICDSGAEAIKLVAAGAKPDLLLLDVMMPGMDGPTILENLRKLPTTTGTPVMFVTARVQPDEVAHYQSLGAIGVITKPFDPMQLADQIRKLWNNETPKFRPDNGLETKLQEFHLKFAQTLPQQLDDIRQALGRCTGGQIDHAHFAELYRLLHSLSGLAGTVGHAEISNRVHEIELQARGLTAKASLAPGDIAQMTDELESFLAWASTVALSADNRRPS